MYLCYNYKKGGIIMKNDNFNVFEHIANRDYYVLNKTITIKINDDFNQKLDFIMKSFGKTNKSDVIRDAVSRYYNQIQYSKKNK